MNDSNLQPIIAKNGTIVLGSKVLNFPNINVREQIGSGKNGLVFRVEHEFLGRDAALKIWQKIKPNDRRDKFKQGILEARKAASADNSDVVAKIYDAGELEGIFYCTMELFEGATATEWSGLPAVSFLQRCNLAVSVVWESSKLAHKGIVHGDLHTDNILVQAPKSAGASDFEYKIIDFGTSSFVQPEFSSNRHWRIVEETVNRLAFPFNVTRLLPIETFRATEQVSGKVWRYNIFFEHMRHYLIALGAYWLDHYSDGPYTLSDPDHMKMENSIFTPEVKSEMRKIFRSGKIQISEDNIGPMQGWYDLTNDRLNYNFHQTFGDIFED